MSTVTEAQQEIDRLQNESAEKHMKLLQAEGTIDTGIGLYPGCLYKQSQVDHIATAVRNSITVLPGGEEKLYTYGDLLGIVTSILNNPTHKERPVNVSG